MFFRFCSLNKDGKLHFRLPNIRGSWSFAPASTRADLFDLIKLSLESEGSNEWMCTLPQCLCGDRFCLCWYSVGMKMKTKKFVVFYPSEFDSQVPRAAPCRCKPCTAHSLSHIVTASNTAEQQTVEEVVLWAADTSPAGQCLKPEGHACLLYTVSSEALPSRLSKSKSPSRGKPCK